MPQYPRRLVDRHAQVMGQIQRKQRRFASRISSVDGGFPVAANIGVVASITSGPTVFINGATTATGPLPYLAGYTPHVGDSVLLLPLGVNQVYVIVGVLTYPSLPGA